jgi:hypothetical protein
MKPLTMFLSSKKKTSKGLYLQSPCPNAYAQVFNQHYPLILSDYALEGDQTH